MRPGTRSLCRPVVDRDSRAVSSRPRGDRPRDGASGRRAVAPRAGGLLHVLAPLSAVARSAPLRRGCRAGTVAGDAGPRLPLADLLETRDRGDSCREARGAPGAVVDRLLGPSHAGPVSVARTPLPANTPDSPLPQRRGP